MNPIEEEYHYELGRQGIHTGTGANQMGHVQRGYDNQLKRQRERMNSPRRVAVDGTPGEGRPILAFSTLVIITLGCWIGSLMAENPTLSGLLLFGAKAATVVTVGAVMLFAGTFAYYWLISFRAVRIALWIGAAMGAVFGYFYFFG